MERRQDRLDALRKIIAEPVFGQIKGARGLDRFLLRGLEKVEGEWTLMATPTTSASCTEQPWQQPEGGTTAQSRSGPGLIAVLKTPNKEREEGRLCLWKCATRS